MVTVYVSEHESIEAALKRFSKKVQDARIILEVKERQAFMKPSDRRRKDRAAGKARAMKKQRKMEKMLEFLSNNKVPTRRPRPFNNANNQASNSAGGPSPQGGAPTPAPHYNNRDRKPQFRNDFKNDRQKRTVYVGGLSYRTLEDSLSAHFSTIAKVESVKIILDRETQKSRGFGFVELTLESDVQSVIDAFNETEFEGRRIMVSANKTKSEKDKERPVPARKPPTTISVSEEDIQELQAKLSGKTA
jgi:ribosomal protein S21